MAIELSFLGPLITLVKDIGGYVVKRFKKPDPVETLQRRDKWRVEFEERLRKKDSAGTHGNAIIRDVKRMDRYPDIKENERRISAWFRVEVKGLYHRGLEVFINIESLVFDEEHGDWRFGQHDEPGAVSALLVGQIPFDVIRTVSWNGDEYYPFPHIYCDFSRGRGQPYEELVFYQAQDGSHETYFLELAKLKDVKKLSKKLGHKS